MTVSAAQPAVPDGLANPLRARRPGLAVLGRGADGRRDGVAGGIPLTGMATAGAASVTGLRTGNGALVLRIERSGAAVQVRFRDGEAFPDEGGLSLLREVRIKDLWEGPCTPSPRAGRGTGMANF